MRSKLLRFGSVVFAFGTFVALIAPPLRAADEEPKPKSEGEEDGEKPKKRKKKAAEGEEGTAPEAKPKGDGDDEDGEKPKKRRKAKKDEDAEEEGAKPAKAPAVDDTAGLKEIGTDSVAATSPIGRVRIDNHLPTEVGKWGWTWFGDTNFGPTTTGGDFKISMVGVRNWFSPKMGWEAGTGLTLSKAAGDGAPTNYCWGFTGGLLYSLARYEYVNVFAAGRAVIVPFCKPNGETTDPASGTKVAPGSLFQFGLSGEVAVEIFLDAFQPFHAGPFLKTSRSMSITFGSGLSIRYTKIGDTTTTLADGTSTSAGATSSASVNTSNVVNGLSNFVGSPTGSVAFTYYF